MLLIHIVGNFKEPITMQSPYYIEILINLEFIMP